MVQAPSRTPVSLCTVRGRDSVGIPRNLSFDWWSGYSVAGEIVGVSVLILRIPFSLLVA